MDLYHKWSGWPGAYCLLCGSEDPIEIALADNWYDPLTNTWDTEEHRKECEKYLICPVMKAKQNLIHNIMQKYKQ